MAFGVPGAMVNVARSNDRQVLLQNVQKASAGIYRCQVSVEGSFRSVSVEKSMTVVDADNSSSSSLVNNKQVNHRNTAYTQGQQLNRGGQKGEANFITSMLEPITQGQHQSSSGSSLRSNSISWCAIQLVIMYSILSRTWCLILVA